MSTAVLEVSKLNIRLTSGGHWKQVVEDFNLTLEAGETVGLVGESGCGKTMTAMAIMGLLPATAARISCAQLSIKGQDTLGLDGSQRRAILGRDISMVFQQPSTALDPVFTIGQQINRVYRRHIGGGRADVNQAMLESLSEAGFDDPGSIASAYPHQLSGGMRQLAMIAMAMVCKPAVIIADEPTTALDAESNHLILEQLKTLQSRHGTAILLISHDLSSVRNICSRVMVMYCGRIVEKASAPSLFSNPKHPYSAGLLSCVPGIDEGQPEPVQPIPGQVPAQLPDGCHFAPRCSRAAPECSKSAPRLDPAGPGTAACFRPLP